MTGVLIFQKKKNHLNWFLLMSIYVSVFHLMCSTLPCVSTMGIRSDPIHWLYVSQLPNTYCVLSCEKSINPLSGIVSSRSCLSDKMWLLDDGFIKQNGQLLACRRKISKTTWKHNMGSNWQMHPFALPELQYAWLAFNTFGIKSLSDVCI